VEELSSSEPEMYPDSNVGRKEVFGGGRDLDSWCFGGDLDGG